MTQNQQVIALPVLIEFIKPIIIGLGSVFLVALVIALFVVWRTGHLPFFSSAGRRLDDKLFGRLLDIQESHSKAVNNLAEAIREGSVASVAQMQKQSEAFMAGLRDIHERIDAYLAPGPSAEKAHARRVAGGG